MSEPANETTLWIAVIGAASTVVVGLISFFGGRGSIQAQVQSSINAGFQALTASLQSERSALEIKVTALEHRVDDLEGDLNNQIQFSQSLERVLRDHGLELPMPRPLLKSATIIEFRGGQAHGGAA